MFGKMTSKAVKEKRENGREQTKDVYGKKNEIIVNRCSLVGLTAV